MDNDADYVVDDFSDFEDDGDDDSSSSEDELQAFIKKKCGIVDIKDDFEDEMDKAMTAHMKKLNKEQSHGPENDKPPTSEDAASTGTALVLAEQNKEKTEEEKNDELFYDPGMDEADQKWIDDKRRAYIFPSTPSSSLTTMRPLPNSDAVLNCPACLSLLCLDCQRHEVYNNQYRAMFVSNCNVVTGETLLYPNKKKKKASDENDVTNSVYNPVRCVVCNTEVAVYDSDEVYHFFNVLASYA